jgi:plastocyanin
MAVLLPAVIVAGCDRGNGNGASLVAQSRPAVPAGAGVIAGTVELAGKAPEMREIPNSACHPGGPLVRDESVVADDGGRLANVVVYLKDGPPVDVPAAGPAVLDQAGCRYVPHVVALRTGQTLTIRSSDATLHNVHGQCSANPAFNVGMTGPGQSRDFTFARPEVFKVGCDVHPWMAAHVAVFDHPMFAVTGEGGRFEIKRVPPGTYTLVAWHERLGTRQQQVTVPPAAAAGAEAEKAVVVDLTFSR